MKDVKPLESSTFGKPIGARNKESNQMDEKRIEAALMGLSMQMPRAPARKIEDMVRVAAQLSQERAKHLGITAEPPTRQDTLSAGDPEKEKNNNRTL